MSALTKDKDTPERIGDIHSRQLAAGVKSFMGGIAVINASGYSQPGTAATGLIVDGRYEEQVDNSSGADGDSNAIVKKGVFKWINSSANPITLAHLEQDCYIEDDQTVGSLATGMSRAGKVVGVESDGIWVDTRK